MPGPSQDEPEESLSALLEACEAGDERAWSTLVDRYAGLIYAIPRDLGLSPTEAEDVVQIVFATLVRRLSTIRDPQALPKWLMTTARRECWRQLRRTRSTEHPAADPEPIHHDAPTIDALEQRQAVRHAMLRLDDRCRRLLTLLFVDDPTPAYADISDQIGIPVGSIGPTRARCLQRLLELIDDDDAPPEPQKHP